MELCETDQELSRSGAGALLEFSYTDNLVEKPDIDDHFDSDALHVTTFKHSRVALPDVFNIRCFPKCIL